MSETPKLERALGFWPAFSIVAGCVIGTGVFIKASSMTQALGSPSLVMVAYVVAGLLSLSGALVYAELGSLYPQAGGEYVYLRESFGDFTAYLYGWTRVLIASPATLAAYAVGAASFLSSAIDLQPFGGVVTVSIFFLLFFTAINCLKVSVGGNLQTAMTLLKVALIAGVAALLFFKGDGSFANLSSHHEVGNVGLSAFGVAMIAALWAYDGWNNLPMIAGEIKNPKRNLPLSLIVGMLAVLVLYAAVNLGYFFVLPASDVAMAYSDQFPEAMPAATKAVTLVAGTTAAGWMSILFVISALGGLNGSTMSSARVPYAMAEDGLFFKALKHVHPKTHVPTTSIVIQGVLACVYALSGKFDQITNYVVFSSWIFYALVAASIFKFRKLHKMNDEKIYRTWGYPWMPVLFIGVAILLLINTIYVSPKDSVIGLVIIAAGIPIYRLYKKKI